ncbi:MAG: NAD-dependent epimerase/dehydratase family protein [Cyanobium sp. PLM2.Bin73]|nr:MAG: NAD-dependent epimerase/dehydratase family protein [Cyanobium sp. PLM2.Bin73]
MTTLLITGGAGFIGIHTALVLLEAGHFLVVLDNFSNSSQERLLRLPEVASQNPRGGLALVAGDIPARDPLHCLDVNLNGSRQLLVAMQEQGRHTSRSPADIDSDGWAWQSANPHGSAKAEGAER